MPNKVLIGIGGLMLAGVLTMVLLIIHTNTDFLSALANIFSHFTSIGKNVVIDFSESLN